jgi:hypothetical protein
MNIAIESILEAGDQLLMLADKDSMAKIRTLLESKGT